MRKCECSTDCELVLDGSVPFVRVQTAEAWYPVALAHLPEHAHVTALPVEPKVE